MKKETIIEGLNRIIEGATMLRDELSGGAENETPATDNGKATKSVGKRTKVQKEETAPAMNEPEETEAPATANARFSREDLDAMKYNDLKKLGASLGVPCTGKRAEITDRILAVDVEVTADPVDGEDSGKVVPISKGKKGGLKKAKKEEEAEAEAEEEKEPEISEEAIQMAKEVSEDMTAKEIIDYLADLGIKASGKKSDVVLVLAQAIDDGKVEFEDDDEEEEEVEEQVEEDVADDEEGEEINADTYFADYDPEGINDPDNMTDERKEAVHNMMEEVLEQIENESIKEEDMATFCETFCTEDELEMLGDEYEFEDLVALFCETKKRFIDNDGAEYEAEEPYEIGEDNFCCGQKLKYEKKSKKFICENCGAEYEAE